MFESKRKTQRCEVSTLRGVMGCCKSSRGFSVQGSTQRANAMSLTTTPAVSSPCMCVCVCGGGEVARQQAPSHVRTPYVSPSHIHTPRVHSHCTYTHCARVLIANTYSAWLARCGAPEAGPLAGTAAAVASPPSSGAPLVAAALVPGSQRVGPRAGP